MKMESKATLSNYLELHFIVFIWGFTAVLGDLINIDTYGVVFFRTFIALLGFLYLFRMAKKSFRLERKEMLKILGVGIIVGLHWLTFFGAVKIAGASIALIGISTTTLWTSLIEPMITEKKFEWFELVLGAVIIVGIWIIGSETSIEGGVLGLFVGILSALLATIFSVINVNFSQKHDAQIVSFYELVGAMMTAAIFILCFLSFDSSYTLEKITPSSYDFLFIALLGLVCTVYPFTKSISLLRKFSAYTINLTVNLEPIYGVILAAIILGESKDLNSSFYLGGVIIMLAVFSFPLLKRFFKKQRERMELKKAKLDV